MCFKETVGEELEKIFKASVSQFTQDEDDETERKYISDFPGKRQKRY